MFKNYFSNYTDVPKGTGRIIPLIIVESLAMCLPYFISIYFVNVQHFSNFQVGQLLSTMSFGTCIGSLISGYLTTKMPPIKVSSLGLFIYGIGLLLLAVNTSFIVLLGIMFCCGIGGVFMMIANLTALITLTHDDAIKNRLIVLQSVIFNASISFFGFLISYLNHGSIIYLFIILGLLLLASGIIVFNFKIQKPTPSNKADKANITISGSLLTLLSAVFFYGVIFSLIKIYFPLEATSRFHNPLMSWVLLSVNPLIVIFIQPLLFNKLGKTRDITLLATGGVLLGIGYLLFGTTTLFLPSVIFISIATFGEMIFSPVSKKLASTLFGSGKEGLGLASWKMTYYLSGVFGAFSMGYLTEAYKNINIWFVCLLLSLAMTVSVVCYSSVNNKTRVQI